MKKTNATAVTMEDLALELANEAAVEVNSSGKPENVLQFVPTQKRKQKIVVASGDLASIYNQSVAALSQTGRFYIRGGLVVLGRDDTPHHIKSSVLKIALAGIIDWVKHVATRAGGVEEIPCDPPRDIPIALAESTNLSLPNLKAVVKQPFLKNDGTLLRAGYNQDVEVFGSFNEANFVVPTDPTAEQIYSAITRLRSAFQTFDFEAAHDWFATLCTIFCAVSRPSLATAPLHLIGAPTAGSGKGLLARSIALFADPNEPPATTLPEAEEELKKELLTVLIKARQVLFFDEINHHEIDSPSLRTLATSPNISGRLLGKNQEITVSTNILVIMTANNGIAASDTARRILQIRLDPRCENPSLRQFASSPIDFIKKNRNQLIVDVLTLQMAYLKSGLVANVVATGSFEDWDKHCRLPALHFTQADPAKRMHDALLDDPRKIELGGVLQAWHNIFSSESKSAGDVFLAVADYSSGERFASLRACLQEAVAVRGPLTSRGLGRWIARHVDRIAGGLVLKKSSISSGTQTYRVMKVAPN